MTVGNSDLLGQAKADKHKLLVRRKRIPLQARQGACIASPA